VDLRHPDQPLRHCRDVRDLGQLPLAGSYDDDHANLAWPWQSARHPDNSGSPNHGLVATLTNPVLTSGERAIVSRRACRP
jgi:hypothetical protein